MNKNILVLGLLLSFSPVFASGENFVNYVVKDGYSDFTCKYANDSVDLASLDKAEIKILGKTFPSDLPDKRLSRIESKIFGAIQSGSYLKRMNMINQYSNKCLISSVAAGGGGFRPYNYRNRFGSWRRPFGTFNSGTLTGYTPPIGYTSYNPYYSSGIYNSNPYLVNSGVGTRIRRFFNPNYNNHYLNSPAYNPYLNGNYNNLNNTRYIPLFNGGTGGGLNGQTINGFGLDTTGTTNSGASVTIID